MFQFEAPTIQPEASGSHKNDFDPDAMDQDVDELFHNASVAVPGEQIADASEWMRGHGTYLDTENSAVLAGVAGRVERVNKLVSVRALRGRYKPEVGDLVVGRVMEVQAKRWKVDIGARLDAVLMLSSINLPGGVQRRKLESDELQMRNYFTEGDLLVCEVQTFFGDGSVSLHTRSLRAGKLKLRNGTLVQLPSPAMMPRFKSHFISLPCGVDIVAGLNGRLWVYASLQSSSSSNANSNDAAAATGGAADNEVADAEALYAGKNDDLPIDKRAAVARMAACLHVLAENKMLVTEARMALTWEASLEGNGDAMDEDSGHGSSYTVQQLMFDTKARSDLLSRVLAASDDS